MITHFHTQALFDAKEGANIFTVKEPSLFAVWNYSRLFTSACCINGVCALNLLKFSDN